MRTFHGKSPEYCVLADTMREGTPDDVLWQRVQDERRFLMTADKGFADLRHQAPGTHAGVILLRSPEESRRAYVELAATAIDRLELDEIAGAIIVVTSRGIRIRRARKP